VVGKNEIRHCKLQNPEYKFITMLTKIIRQLYPRIQLNHLTREDLILDFRDGDTETGKWGETEFSRAHVWKLGKSARRFVGFWELKRAQRKTSPRATIASVRECISILLLMMVSLEE
jgi:hypothetical protein